MQVTSVCGRGFIELMSVMSDDIQGLNLHDLTVFYLIGDTKYGKPEALNVCALHS